MSRCSLCACGKRVARSCVRSSGSRTPKIMIVIDYPTLGDTEHDRVLSENDAVGKKCLSLLQAARIPEEDCFFTSLVRCTPLDTRGIKPRPPERGEIQVCTEAYLKEEIAALEPKLIVTMGMAGAEFFHGKIKSLNEVNGKIVTVDHAVGGVTVLSTYNPSAMLRGENPAFFENAGLTALAKARAHVYGTTVPRMPKTLLDTVEKVEVYCETLKDRYADGNLPFIIVDCETTAFNPWLSGCPDLLLFAICDGENVVSIPYNHRESPFYLDTVALRAISTIINDSLQIFPVSNHNIKFDYHWLRTYGMRIREIYGDTMLAAWTLFNNQVKHDLESLATRYTPFIEHKQELKTFEKALPKYLPLEPRYMQNPRFDPEKDEKNIKYDLKLKRYLRRSNYGDIPLSILHPYCCDDVESTYHLQIVFDEMLHAEKLYDGHQLVTVRSILPVAEMEWNGAKIDKTKFKIEEKRLEETIDASIQWFDDNGYIDRIYHTVNDDPNEAHGKPFKSRDDVKITATRAKAILLFDILGITPEKTTDKGNDSTDAEVLESELKKADDILVKIKDSTQPISEHKVLRYMERKEVIERIIQLQSDQKLLGTYIKPIPLACDEHDIGHASYGIRTSDTGRFTTKGHPSWLLIPRGSSVKKAIIPHHPDGLIAMIDQSQMELRILAHFTQDETMLQAFREGKDIHTYLAAMAYQIDESQVTKDMRSSFKKIDFGIIYGIHESTVAASLNKSEREIRHLFDKFFRTFPKVKRYIDERHRLAKREKAIWTPWGLRRLIEDGHYSEAERERKWVNTPIQSTAADFLTVGLGNIYRDPKAQTLQSTIWAAIHDALGWSIAPGELLEVVMLTKYHLEQWPKDQCPWLTVNLAVDVEVGVSWGEMCHLTLQADGKHALIEGKVDYFHPLKQAMLRWPDPPELLEVTMTEDKKNSENDTVKSFWKL